MSFDDFLPALAIQVALKAPGAIACIVGIAMCLTWRRRIGTGAVYAVAAFALHILSDLLSLTAQVWIYKTIASGAGAGAANTVSGAIGAIQVVISVVATGLLIAAVLARRPAAQD